MKFRLLAVLLGSIALTTWAYTAQFNMSPYVDTASLHNEEVIATDTLPGISDTLQVIGAQEIQATIVSSLPEDDSLYVTLEVSNDRTSWMNASANGDSEKVKAGTIISLHFSFASTYRFYRLRTSVVESLHVDTLAVSWRIGNRTASR